MQSKMFKDPALVGILTRVFRTIDVEIQTGSGVEAHRLDMGRSIEEKEAG